MLHYKDFELKNYTSFKIGGKAKNVYLPETNEEFVELLQTLPHPIVLGGMSNVLIASAGVFEDVILTKKLNKFSINDNEIYAQAGVMGPILSRQACENSLSGMEFMCGFPGSVGGIVSMNAGAHGQCISEIFEKATVFDCKNKELKIFYKNDMNFEYRKSIILNSDLILIDATFCLLNKEKDLILEKVKENNEFRKNKQPNLSKPNCGSVFKNPQNVSAGMLLDSIGAKEFQVGGAKVYENHANFIINFDNATSCDVLKLMKKMYNKVYEKYSIRLIPEVRFIGDKTEEEKEIWNELLNN